MTIQTNRYRPPKQGMRSYYTTKIESLLAEHGQMTRGRLAAELGIALNTLDTYLRYMRNELGMIRQIGKYLDGRPLWELGQDTGERRTNAPVKELHKQQQVVPAQQVGMWRDGLVAALFGPAQGAATERMA